MPPPPHGVTSGWTTGNTDTQPDNDSSLHNSHHLSCDCESGKETNQANPKRRGQWWGTQIPMCTELWLSGYNRWGMACPSFQSEDVVSCGDLIKTQRDASSSCQYYDHEVSNGYCKLSWGWAWGGGAYWAWGWGERWALPDLQHCQTFSLQLWSVKPFTNFDTHGTVQINFFRISNLILLLLFVFSLYQYFTQIFLQAILHCSLADLTAGPHPSGWSCAVRTNQSYLLKRLKEQKWAQADVLAV